MTELTSAQRLTIRAKLAEAQGWTDITKAGTGFPPGMQIGIDDEREPLPDPFTKEGERNER